MLNFFMGLDLGQAQDYTALAIVEKVTERNILFGTQKEQYLVRHLQRFPLGTTYPVIVDRVLAMTRKPPLAGKMALVIDATGVGRPVVDLFRQEGLKPIAVTITGGSTVTPAGGGYRVPKRDLVSALAVMLQTKRLKISRQLPDAKTLIEELLNFRVTINPRTAHDSYEAWREGTHDDLVLATALACWYGKRHRRMAPIAKPEGW